MPARHGARPGGRHGETAFGYELDVPLLSPASSTVREIVVPTDCRGVGAVRSHEPLQRTPEWVLPLERAGRSAPAAAYRPTVTFTVSLRPLFPVAEVTSIT
jgi:hypothetical protein